MNKKTVMIVVVGLLAGAIGLWLGAQSNKSKELPMQLAAGAFVYPQPQEMPAFELIDHNQQRFGKEALQGKWSFLFFGYTYCPDICPLALQQFNQVHQLLDAGEKGVSNTQFVFISVDPARDTPERLNEYVKYFNPEFIGATGTDQEIQNMAKAFNIVAQRAAGDERENYLVDHSSAVMLMDPQGRRFALFNAPHDPKVITEAFETIRNHVENS